MLASVKDSVKNLEKSKIFKDYFKENKDSYLSSCFLMLPEQKSWQLDYYNPKKDNMTSFIANKKITSQESAIFKIEKLEIEKLEVQKIKLNLKQALKKIENIRKKKYPNEKATKIIIIIQKVNKKPLWNITYLTTSFKTFNIKIDAITGKIIKEELRSLFSFEK